MTGKKSFAAYYNDREDPEIIEAVGLDEAEDIALERCDNLKGARPPLGKDMLASSSFVKYAIYDNDSDPADTPEYLTGGHVEQDPEEPPCPEQTPGHDWTETWRFTNGACIEDACRCGMIRITDRNGKNPETNDIGYRTVSYTRVKPNTA